VTSAQKGFPIPTKLCKLKSIQELSHSLVKVETFLAYLLELSNIYVCN